MSLGITQQYTHGAYTSRVFTYVHATPLYLFKSLCVHLNQGDCVTVYS